VNLLGEPVQVTHRSDKAPRDVDWALTTNMAVRKDVFEQVGGFAEVYGIYDEDVDLGLKIRGAGYGIVFQPGTAVYHYYLKRGPKPVTVASEFMLGRNRSMMLVRNFGVLSRVWLFLFTAPWLRLWSEMVYSKRRALTRLPCIVAYMLGSWKGIVDGLMHPTGKDRVN
jgi:GT2 family glycosyltransferase